MTKEEAIAWAKAQVGKSLDFDGYYGAQCMDLILYYCAKFGWRPYGNAVDLKNATVPSGWQKIQNSATFVPEVGDIFIFTMAPYGHTGIITSANMNSFTSIDQNWVNASNNGSAGANVTHNYNTFWGVIRPPFRVGATRQQIEAAYLEVLERNADEGGIQTYLNTQWGIERVKQALMASDEYKWLRERKATEQAAAVLEAQRKEAEALAIAKKAEADRLAKIEADRLAAEKAQIEANEKAQKEAAEKLKAEEAAKAKAEEALKAQEKQVTNIVDIVLKYIAQLITKLYSKEK